jgi:hypothetical protein|tara:strand:+ start:307 stop:477 length:171 start_codon:yes stop_codon:yes gene_type:complete
MFIVATGYNLIASCKKKEKKDQEKRPRKKEKSEQTGLGTNGICATQFLPSYMFAIW